ncbi:hypothetical protein PV703_24955 [Streptomyces sp. ME01-24h]|nr:hypothetical protein [Streptomyces sp. ME19-03-3]MDX3356497.1 hypothetical protein [Streptomyces sp. ME01-24h]
MRERSRRDHWDVAYCGDAVVDRTTVRRPARQEEDGTATVIVRVLPGHRGRGLGARLHRGTERGREMGAATVETIVLPSNTEVALRRGTRLVEADAMCCPGGHRRTRHPSADPGPTPAPSRSGVLAARGPGHGAAGASPETETGVAGPRRQR